MTVRVICLDLEGTLVSNAMSQFPRPGLRAFLEFCFARFERVALFTQVRTEVAREVMRTLVRLGDAPPEAVTRLEHVQWSGTIKDLGFVPGVAPEEALLLDDNEEFVREDQRDRWIEVLKFAAPYSTEDRELERVRALLEQV